MTTYILILCQIIGLREAVACAESKTPAAVLATLWEEEQ